MSGFVLKEQSVELQEPEQREVSKQKSYYDMVEFTRMLTQLSKPEEVSTNEVEHKDQLEEPKAKESDPNCACICHPEKECDDGECKCKASSVALMTNRGIPLKAAPKEEILEKAVEPQVPGLSSEDVKLLSEAMEPLEDRTNELEKLNEDVESTLQDGPIVLIPNPPLPQIAPIMLLPRPLTDSQKECQCYMRRLQKDDIPNTPLTPIEKVSPEVSQAAIKNNDELIEEIKENTEIAQIPHVEPTSAEIRRCADNCECSCHHSDSRQDVRFIPGLLPPVEPNQSPQSKCIELCIVHCPQTPTGRPGSHVPLVEAEDSLVVASKRASSSASQGKYGKSDVDVGKETKAKSREGLEEETAAKSGGNLEEKSEAKSSVKSSGKQSFLKRLSNSLRRSK